MAKANIWQWDETAASNTELDGISLAENVMVPSDVNNAIREMMSQVITIEGKGADVASAGTVTLGAERYYHITGTTTITDIDFTDAVDGRWAWLIFDGALTLTHNATSLKLPGGVNITTAADDRALFVQDNSNNVICLCYVRAVAPPVAGWEHITTVTPAAAASIDVTNLSAYRQLRISGYLRPSTDGATGWIRTSTDNGSNFDSGASDYITQALLSDDTVVSAAETTSTAYNFGTSSGNLSTEGVAFTVSISEFNNNRNCRFVSQAQMVDADGTQKTRNAGGVRAQATGRNAISIRFSSGSITDGQVVIEGLRG
jgi:hypothetical protein